MVWWVLNRKIESLEVQKSALATEAENLRVAVDHLAAEKEEKRYDAFYVEDLEAKLEAYRERENELLDQLEEANNSSKKEEERNSIIRSGQD